MKKTITVARDFSRFPAGRFRTDGPNSGERFREEYLWPSLAAADQVEVVLDGTLGYGSSFLEEAFGGLVRVGRCSADQLRRKLALTSSDQSLKLEIWSYINDAKHGDQAHA